MQKKVGSPKAPRKYFSDGAWLEGQANAELECARYTRRKVQSDACTGHVLHATQRNATGIHRCVVHGKSRPVRKTCQWQVILPVEYVEHFNHRLHFPAFVDLDLVR